MSQDRRCRNVLSLIARGKTLSGKCARDMLLNQALIATFLRNSASIKITGECPTDKILLPFKYPFAIERANQVVNIIHRREVARVKNKPL